MRMTRFHLLLIYIAFFTLQRERAYAQTSSSISEDFSQSVMLYFRFNRSLLEKDYLTNNESMDTLRAIMTNKDILSQMDSIVIQASASPEGNQLRNQQLSLERAAAVKSYLMWQYPYLDRDKIQTHSIGENWEGLKQMVTKDPNVPHRSELFNLIDSDLDSHAKDIRLQQLGGGETFAYLTLHIFRYLRSGAACIVFYQKSPMEEVPQIEVEDTPVEEPVTEPAQIDSCLVKPVSDEPDWLFRRPIALKSNLLFDLATALNVEIEVPLGNRFSIAAEWIFPWWLWEKQQNCLEILSGTLEGRYWIKPSYTRQDPALGFHNPLTGWFAGLYSSVGKYDLEWNKKGFQGEVYISGGLTLGYVKSLSRNLNMEFSLSAGYMQSDYRHYQAQQDALGEWHLIKQNQGTFKWIGPTKAKVSLLWYPHFKSTKKGGKNR